MGCLLWVRRWAVFWRYGDRKDRRTSPWLCRADDPGVGDRNQTSRATMCLVVTAAGRELQQNKRIKDVGGQAGDWSRPEWGEGWIVLGSSSIPFICSKKCVSQALNPTLDSPHISNWDTWRELFKQRSGHTKWMFPLKKKYICIYINILSTYYAPGFVLGSGHVTWGNQTCSLPPGTLSLGWGVQTIN